MDKFFYYNELFSIYKDLLTEKEKEIFSLYYEENLSMGEISENKQISRSAVGSKVKTVEQKLDYYESVIKKYQLFQRLSELLENGKTEDFRKKIEQILEDK